MERKSPTNGACAGERGFNSKSTVTAAQYVTILTLLAIRPHNTEELRRQGVYQVSARVKELRMMGHDIRTARINLWDRDGFLHRGVALYSLHGGDHE